MDAVIRQDENQIIYVFCMTCVETVGNPMVPIGPIQQAFDILTEHNAEVHPE
jgi:hypothetical protein